MIRIHRRVSCALLALSAVRRAVRAAPAGCRPAPIRRTRSIIDTTEGRVVIKLRNDLAPKHAERFKQLARDRLLRQRAVPPRHPRLHGADRRRPARQRHRRLEISGPEAEFSNVPFKRGIVGMARTSDPNSANTPVLHHVRRRRLPQRQIHRGRRGRVRHGLRRQDQEGRRGQQRQRSPTPTRSSSVRSPPT